MLQQVLQGGDYSLFTQIALVLFFMSFIILLVLAFLRPRSLNDKYARMPLSDDYEIDSPTLTARSDETGQGENDHE